MLFFFVDAKCALCSQLGIVVEIDHFSDNLVSASVEMAVIIVDAWIVTALVENPLFFTWSEFSLKLTIILADHAL